MVNSVKKMIEENVNASLMLVDIGVWAFHELLEKYPQRVKNIGIFEDGTISIAAGLALGGVIPTVYGISPFIVQRALEQLKLDFAYQKLGGNFITTGASYDFSTLGYSHYCPEDVATLKTIPGIEVLCPGSPSEFTSLFNQCWNDGCPTYYRMTDFPNKTTVNVEFGKANVIKTGTKATVITAGEMLDTVLEACKDFDVTVIYYSTLEPFDYETLRNNFVGEKVFVSTPFYNGTLTNDIMKALGEKKFLFKEKSVPRKILRNYGTKTDKDLLLGLTKEELSKSLKEFINK